MIEKIEEVFVLKVIKGLDLIQYKLKLFMKTFIVICIFASTCTLQQVKAESWGIVSPYAYVFNSTTGQVLYSKNENTRVYPASTTKVMTTLVALERMTDLTQTTTVQETDLEGLWEAGASVANFEVGEKVTYKDLIYGIILPSGADACRVTARVLFGSEENMVEAMNQKASDLGLKNTHFVNTTGLHDDNHYSSAHDMAIITQEALKYEIFQEVFSTRYYYTELNDRYMAATILKFHWNTRVDITHIIGCKTGYTSQAKSCLTALIKNNQDQNIICTFMKEESSSAYVSDARAVMNHCNQSLSETTLYSQNDEVESIEIKDGVKNTYTIKVPENITLYLENGEGIEDYSLEYDGDKEITAPVEKDTELGQINLKYNDQIIKSYTAVIDENIDVTVFAKVIRFIAHNIIFIILGIILFLVALAHFIRWRIRVRRRKRKELLKRMARRGY